MGFKLEIVVDVIRLPDPSGYLLVSINPKAETDCNVRAS